MITISCRYGGFAAARNIHGFDFSLQDAEHPVLAIRAHTELLPLHRPGPRTSLPHPPALHSSSSYHVSFPPKTTSQFASFQGTAELVASTRSYLSTSRGYRGQSPLSPLRRRVAENPPWVLLRHSCPWDVVAGVVLGLGVHVGHHQLFLCRPWPRQRRFGAEDWFRNACCSPGSLIGKVPCGTDSGLRERSGRRRTRDSHRAGPQPPPTPPERRKRAWGSTASPGLGALPVSTISPIRRTSLHRETAQREGRALNSIPSCSIVS